MSYRTLEIWQLAREVSIEIHGMTVKSLPKLEMYEEGAQIRRSAKSIRSNIVEDTADEGTNLSSFDS